MPKTGVIDELAAHRALERLPEVWVDLAYGRVGPDEASAAARAHEPAALVERTARMLAPPSVAQSQARLEALLEACAPARPRRQAASRRWIFGGVLAAVAAAAVLVLVLPGRQPLPAFDAGYELELSGALAVDRDVVPPSAAGEVPRFRADRPVRWILRPGRRVTETLDVRAFARREDGHAITLSLASRVTEAGLVEISGEPRAWGLEAGRWQLLIVVGPPPGLPSAPSDVVVGEGAPYEVESVWVEVLQASASRE